MLRIFHPLTPSSLLPVPLVRYKSRFFAQSEKKVAPAVFDSAFFSPLFQGAILKYLPTIINDIKTVFDPMELR